MMEFFKFVFGCLWYGSGPMRGTLAPVEDKMSKIGFLGLVVGMLFAMLCLNKVKKLTWKICVIGILIWICATLVFLLIAYLFQSPEQRNVISLAFDEFWGIA